MTDPNAPAVTEIDPETGMLKMLDRRKDRIRAVAEARQQAVVVLEDIYDPHNAMAVIRSCDAFGIQRICIIAEKQKHFKKSNIGKSSSASARKWLDIDFYDSTEECLTSLKEDGFTLVSTMLAEDSVSMDDVDFLANPKTALIFGNEHRGVSDKAAAMSDVKMIVPMTGMVQSLNLSVTAAICIHEMTRQRREAGMETFQFQGDARENLVQDFLQRGSRAPKPSRLDEIDPPAAEG